MFKGLESEYKNFSIEFDQFSRDYFVQLKLRANDLSALTDSIEYSFSSGGKRFRPFLSYLIALIYKQIGRKTMSLGFAVELIHTYSLIHDDLPCMDNDDFRRGLPTNHKKFGEDIALLSGDALQSEAFQCLARDPQNSAEDKVVVIGQFAQSIGTAGMVGGQVLDMKSNSLTTLEQLEIIHQKKTGDLITASVLCAAQYATSNRNDHNCLKVFAQNLGLAFQIKDDLLDGLDGAQDHKSYLKLLGVEKTQEKLNHHSSLAKQSLDQLSVDADLLKKIIDFNMNREK